MQFWKAKKSLRSYIWIENDKVKATQVSLAGVVDAKNDPVKLLEYRDKWDEAILQMSREGSVTANHAFQTSTTWAEAEAKLEIQNSTRNTILVTALCAFLTMLVFTFNVRLSCIVLGLVAVVVLGLTFCMTVIMNWSIGPLEIIGIIIFLGYSVTYSLHIAHAYNIVSAADAEEAQAAEAAVGKVAPLNCQIIMAAGAAGPAAPSNASAKIAVEVVAQGKGQQGTEDEARRIRKERARLAMMHIGRATLASAISTVGSSIWLFCCTLIIFNKLATVLIIVTVLSILAALVELPAILVLIGPSDESWLTFLQSVLHSDKAKDQYHADEEIDASSAAKECTGALLS
jgi:predicted RND superfamily exporter protein